MSSDYSGCAGKSEKSAEWFTKLKEYTP